MLERTDRLALAVLDAKRAAEDFGALFDAEVVDVRPDAETGSSRTTLQWGTDQLDLLEPVEDGPVADFLRSGRSGIFAGGFSLTYPAELAAHLEESGIRVRQQADDRYLVLPSDLDGTGIILSEHVHRDRVGLNDKIWQITYAVPALQTAVERYTDLFRLADRFTNYYTHEGFGYDAAITWLDARDGGLLDSLEYIQPNDPEKAAARFVQRNGAGIYMASIETDRIPAIKERVVVSGDGWQDTAFGGFIHPRRLHGLLLALVTYDDWNARRPLPVA